MAGFEHEQSSVRHLLTRLGLGGATTYNPNVAGKETGIDVTDRLVDDRNIGVQVTEVDPYAVPGLARAQEKAITKTAPAGPYFVWRKNDPSVVLNAIARTIKRKVEIAAKHSFAGFDEVWLLVSPGVPELGAVISTSVPTSWLSAADLNSTTDDLVRGSKYSRCFFCLSSVWSKHSLCVGQSLALGKGGPVGRYSPRSA